MSILPASGIGDESTGFYNGVATQSLRTTRGDQSYFYYTPSAGDRMSGTFNYWVKGENFSNTSLARYIFQPYGAQNESNFSFLHHSSTANMAFGGYGVNYFYTTTVLRDETNWYNMMWTWDTSNGTQNNRQRAYLNGVEITSMGSGTRSGVRQELGFGGNHQHNFLANYYPPAGTGADSWIGGHHAYTTYVNGLALDPTAFGEFKNGVWIPKNYATKPSLIAQGTGTAIGDLTSQGGLAGAFDGNRFESYADSAATSGSQATGYIGKNWGSSKTITGFILYSPTQYGFVGSGASTFTVKLYGKNGAPSNSTDGTLLFTSSSVNDNLISTNGERGSLRYFADTTMVSEETISSFTTNTAFTYHWVVITPNTSESIHVSEIEFYEDGNTYFGTGGFRLDFNSSDLNTSGSSRTDPYGSGTDQPNNTIADASGSGNHLTKTTNINVNDFTLDSPENSFATLLPARSGEGASSQTFTEGNLQWTSSLYNYNATGSTINIPTSGKWYIEVYVKTAGSSLSHDFGLGLQGVKTDSMAKQNPATATYGDSTIYVTRRDFASRIEKNLNNVLIADTYSYNAGDIVSIAYDADNGKVYYGLNNAFWAEDGGTDGNPSSGTNHSTTLTTGVEYFFILAQYSNSYVSVTNFGQDSSFAGNKTRQNNADANGIGDFFYAPPSGGYLALCSANLPDPTIGPQTSTQADDHFNPTLYTANSQTAQNIDTVGFQPDWLWIKQRSRSDAHSFYDSSRGIGPILRGNSDDEYSNTNLVTSFRTLGFAVGTDPFAWVNYQSDTLVAWAWKGNGGTTTSHSSGDNSANHASVSQANQTAGFSIVTYTGDVSGNPTKMNHGLGKTPRMIIVKSRSASGSWAVYHENTNTGSSYNHALFLSSSNARTSANNAYWGSDTMVLNDNLFSVNNSTETNTNSVTYVAYLFAEIEGYSRFGGYVGNGSTAGTFIYTGFRPAFIMTKRSDSSGNWYINDSARSPLNSTDLFGGNLYADLQNAESGNGMDMLSNGFRIRNTDSSQNASGGVYIYMAFAEQPFKFSNAR